MRRRVGTVHAVDGISFDIRERRDAGARRRVGLRQDDDHHGDPEPRASRRPARSSCSGTDTAALTPSERFAIRRDLQVVFQDPLASLDPRLPIGDILAEPLETHGVPPAERARRVRELLTLVGLQPEHANRYPAGVLRRTAAAHRHRARARARAEGARARRAGIGARRVDPRRHHQPAGGAAGRARPVVPLRRPRPVGRSPYRRSRGRDVPGPIRGNRRGRRGVRTAGASVHAGAALGHSAAGSAGRSASGGGSSCRATCRTRRIRRRAAGSARAARSSPTS